jgi:hypothetical protein
MSDHLAIRLPFERGQQLRGLAAANGLAITDAIGLLLDHAARTGLAVAAMPGIDLEEAAGAIVPIRELLGDLEEGEPEYDA